MRLLYKIGISISALIVLAVVGYLGYILLLASAFGVFDKDYSRQELIDSYSEHRKDIQHAISFYASIVPVGKEVDIEFEDGGVKRIRVKAGTAKQPTYAYASEIEPDRVDSLTSSLGWNEPLLNKLQKKLEEADCISIQNGEPAVLGFKRSGIGMYFFNVFKNPIADSLREQYTRGCTHIIQSNELVLEYGGGAIGPQCFPNDY